MDDRRIPLDPDQPCLPWRGTIRPDGYGQIGRWRIHRLIYETFVGPIEHGLTIDHVCFERQCVNPAHLRTMDRFANAKRQRRALSATCKRGHLFDFDNTYLGPGDRRTCRACGRLHQATYQARRRAEVV